MRYDENGKMIGQSLLGKAASFGYGAGITISNLAPSILVSYLTGGLTGGAAANAAGTVAMGASAAGNAYKLKLDEGWTPEQARSYAALVGVSESTLQYVLGGISALSGGGNAVGDKILSKALGQIAKIDNAFMKTALNFGARLAVSGFGEGLEEGLQEVLEPLFATIVTGQDYEVDAGDVAYAFLMGFLTSNVFEAPGALRAARASTALDIPRFNSAGMDSYLGANGVDYFEGCRTAEDVKTRYRELIRKNHPDVGGDGAVMADINRQRGIRDAFYQGARKAAESAQRAATFNTQEAEAAQRARETVTAPETETISETMRTQTRGQNTTTQQSRTVNSKTATIVEHLRNNAQTLMRMNPVATVTGQELPKQGSATDRAMAFLQRIGNKVTRSGLGDVLFSRTKLKTSLVGHGVGTAKLETIAAVPAVVQKGEILNHIQNYEGRGYDTYLIGAPVNYKGQSVLVGVVVAKDQQSGRYYVHEVVDSDGNILLSEKKPEGNADNPPTKDAIVIPSGSIERPTDTGYNTGNETGPVHNVQNVPPSSLSADSVPQTGQAVNGESVGLSLPMLEGMQAHTGRDVGKDLESLRLRLPEIEGTYAHTGQDTGIDLESLRLHLPEIEGTQAHTGRDTGRVLESLRLRLPEVEDVRPVGLSLPTRDRVGSQTGQIVNNELERLRLSLPTLEDSGTVEATVGEIGPERPKPPTSEDGLLKIFKSMSAFIRKNGSFDLESAKADYKNFLQTAPEKNKMYLDQSVDAVE